MAVALDIDESDRYYRYVLAGGDPKKFKWSSPDRAGMLNLVGSGATPQERVKNIFESVARGFTKGAMGLKDLPKGGSAEQFFKMMNRPKVQRLEYPDGRVEYRDMEGNLVEMPEGAAFGIVGGKDGESSAHLQ